MKNFLLLLSFLIAAIAICTINSAIQASPLPVGRWTFDNTNNITKAEIGQDLVQVGAINSVAGPESGDGAVRTETGSYFKCYHGISTAPPQTKVNEYTMVFDFSIVSSGVWHCFYQTDTTNSNDGEIFISPDSFIGVAATGYSTQSIKSKTWYRLAISVKNGEFFRYYLDGKLLLDGTSQIIDDRFALDSIVLLFADNDGENAPMDIALFELYDKALSASEVAELGGYTHVNTNKYAIKPYLQAPTDSSIIVSWQKEDSIDSKVYYGESINSMKSVTSEVDSLDDGIYWYSARLTALAAETDYIYRIVCGKDTTDYFHFYSFPKVTKNKGHLRFIVIGDSQEDSTKFDYINQKIREKLTELYGTDFYKKVNLIFHVGDIVSNGNDINQYYAQHFAPISYLASSIPVMISIGNHEQESSYFYKYMKYEDFAGPLGRKFYKFNFGPLLMLSMNSNILNTDQINWVGESVHSGDADSNVEFIFSFQHTPGISELWPDGNNATVYNEIFPILSQSKKSVFNAHGHSHCYERGALKNSSLYMVTDGGAAGGLDRWGMYANQTDYPEIQKSFDHHCWVLVDANLEDSSFSASMYSFGNTDHPKDNELMDSFGLSLKAKTCVAPTAQSPVGSTTLPLNFKSVIASAEDSIMCVELQISLFENDFTGSLDTLLCKDNYFNDTHSPLFTPINLNKGFNPEDFFIENQVLQMDTDYYHRMRFRDISLNWSPWSIISAFRLHSIDKAEEQTINTQSTCIKVVSVFDGSVSIESLKSGQLEIEEYDILGRCIASQTMETFTGSADFRLHKDGSAMNIRFIRVQLITGNGCCTTTFKIIE